ncbi:BREX-1 system adenine-specific DNA-methyltransferase PglX [Pedococcus sp. 5OH_020]|uniref:BREX-1 system adenine-specific DNA-methyltransferase PglX n=1 Tax=Pedococcus sp. 5OH_020 TaxID=2989814 RepID=UPI0022E9E0F1|nr:BREX-1 system adenine-specific DNA-methyltransferase PglX [Pedococcus sp. 5OH_020]
METARLKNFATWARKELIREVTARIAAVLAPGSSERVEQAKAVAALEKAVTAAGGGDKGRAAVADKVAYTWFNRIIALRFMDANGYTGIGVVSPQAAVVVGQPEILAEAKRGVIDAPVVRDATRGAVAGLLDGTRASGDPQGEAYALLLEAYCNHWHKAMPFMFEREGDFTELLVPANLLADDSVLNRSVKVLSEDVCKDVEVIGWLYQFYVSDRKDEVFAGFKKNKKAGADELPAATQLFTPHWIVRYLVENSLGRLWMLNRPNSGLVSQMEYYIAPVQDETDFLKITRPEELRVIDPACGSGHMLTYAFDLLFAIYEEEGYSPAEIPSLILANNLYGTEIDPRAGALAAFALTMKAAAKRKLFLKNAAGPNVCVIEPISFGPDELAFLVTKDGDKHAEEAFWNQFAEADTLGALIGPDGELCSRLARHLESMRGAQDLITTVTLGSAERVIDQATYLTRRYSVLVANPPYMGAGNVNSGVSQELKRRFAGFHGDLFSSFIARSATLVMQGGRVGMMTPNVWLYIATQVSVRRLMMGKFPLRTLVELPLGGFKGATVQVCAFVCGVGTAARNVDFVRLAKEPGNEELLRGLLAQALRNRDNDCRYFERDLTQFDHLPNNAFAYWLTEGMLRAFRKGRTVAEIAEPRVGLQTNDNGRFIRYWHEVSAEKIGRGLSRPEAAASSFKWFPYNKGGDYRKWYGNQDFVVNWERDGAEIIELAAAKYGSATRTVKNLRYYFEPSVSWSKIGTGMPAFRYFPKGFIFDHAGTSAFSSASELVKLAGICNSNVARQMLAATSPTLNLEVGTLAQLPVVDLSARSSEIVKDLIELHRDDWNRSETASDFSRLDLLCAGEKSVALAVADALKCGESCAEHARTLEIELNAEVARLYGIDAEVESDVPLNRVTLDGNPAFKYGIGVSPADATRRFGEDRVLDLVSYAVGCMFGRFSLDQAGLILADEGGTVQDYLGKVPSPTFMPDVDNVIPIMDGDWFEDDIVERFRKFLRAAFGEQHFEENLRFATESLGVKNLRDYFVKSFYKDHVQRYKKRPIYWLFSSPKGSFNALIYMHRYTPSTVSTVLNEYLREFQAKLKASLENAERSSNAKEADGLRKILLELDEYEHDVLYPLASRNVAIDLDHGVKVNYPKFGSALKNIVGLEATS